MKLPGTPLVTYDKQQPIDLAYFVEWHAWLWKPAVRVVLGDPKRFVDKRVLELGHGRGRMSCLFGLLGANVTGVELHNGNLHLAQSEVERWQLQDKISFKCYDGNPMNLNETGFDFVFSKSVLVVIPNLTEFLGQLKVIMNPGGELLAIENMQRGTWLRQFRTRLFRLVRQRRWGQPPYRGFRGVNAFFLSSIREQFKIVKYQQSYGLVAAIQAQKPSE